MSRSNFFLVKRNLPDSLFSSETVKSYLIYLYTLLGIRTTDELWYRYYYFGVTFSFNLITIYKEFTK